MSDLQEARYACFDAATRLGFARDRGEDLTELEATRDVALAHFRALALAEGYVAYQQGRMP